VSLSTSSLPFEVKPRRNSLTSKLKKGIAGIVIVTLLLSAEIILLSIQPSHRAALSHKDIEPRVTSTVSLLAFGDINLGRKVGQRIIKDDVHFPFRRYSIRDDSADIVFANLECQISDQKGETGHPEYNLIFTAPPEAVTTLQQSGITILSTANNHAVDYGISALVETIDRLNEANILFVGTSKVKEKLHEPLIYEKNNIKFAIFGVTAFVNMTFKNWKDYVATPDTVILFEKIKAVRDSVDVVVMSFHGGAEYTNAPAGKTNQFAEWSLRNGVDIFLGHHPHVTFGIQQRGDGFIVHSLGNFIFYQPQHYWTQRSYGIRFQIAKNDSGTNIRLDRIIPVNVSMQTRRLTDSTEVQKLKQRTQQLSNIDLQKYWN
jgi:poly-gamma-glutamate capsule biosynthesis protein CapA/YwtB (metallophosphatase superfamily)